MERNLKERFRKDGLGLTEDIDNLDGFQNMNRKEFEIFSYKNLGSVRTYLDKTGEPWFCLVDVCSILGLGNPSAVSKRLYEKGIISINTLTKGGNQDLLFIDEGNLYEAIGRSRKPEAKEFMNWVYREVLPRLRKSKCFGAPRDESNELENIYNVSKVIVNLYEENQKIKEFINKNEYAINKVNDFVSTGNFDAMEKATLKFSFEGVGLTNLTNWMVANEIISEEFHPLAPYAGMGLFTRREIDHRREDDDRIWFRFELFVTNKGIDYFSQVLEKEGYRKENIKLDGYQKGIITGWVTRIK